MSYRQSEYRGETQNVSNEPYNKSLAPEEHAGHDVQSRCGVRWDDTYTNVVRASLTESWN